MKNQQTEVRHLYCPPEPKSFDIVNGSALEKKFLHWLDYVAEDEVLKQTMEAALPKGAHKFANVFVGSDMADSRQRYIAVSWNETSDRKPVCWGESRPNPIEKYTIKGLPSHMLAAETVAQIIIMLPQEVK